MITFLRNTKVLTNALPAATTITDLSTIFIVFEFGFFASLQLQAPMAGNTI